MTIRSRRPAAPLDRHVACLWYMSGYATPHARERALPTATVELVIDLAGSPMRLYRDDADRQGQSFRDSVICGPQRGYFVLETRDTNAVAGVHFRPGGAAPFLGLPLGELTDRHIALDDIWGPFARKLRNQLLEARTIDEVFDRLEAALHERYENRRQPHAAAAYALENLTDACRIGAVQTRTGYSPRRFIELFRDATGLTPKRYCRIRRFQSVLADYGRHIEWARIAAANGYTDQSHLTREFREFAGVTPSAYVPVRPNHVAAG